MWRYSPVALWVLQPVAIVGGQIGFVLLHFGLLALLPRRVALLVGISFPFWVDVIFGNVFTLVFVAAFWAVRGNGVGMIAFGALTLLMPRPVQLRCSPGCCGASRGSACHSAFCSPRTSSSSYGVARLKHGGSDC